MVSERLSNYFDFCPDFCPPQMGDGINNRIVERKKRRLSEALIPVPLEEPPNGQGDYREGKTIRRPWRRHILCLFCAVARLSNSRGVAINPAPKGTFVRNRAKVSRAAQPRCSRPPDRIITTIAAAAAPRTVC